MTYIILENTICGNAGDGSIMLAAEKILKEACGQDVEVLIFDHDAKTSQDLYLEQTFHQMQSKKLLSGSTFSNFKLRLALSCAKRNFWAGATLFGGSVLAKTLKQYKGAAMVVTTGGGYLNENFNLNYRIRQFQVDTYLGKPPIFFTQSLGPFRKLENRNGLKTALNASPLILLRDEPSKSYLNGLVDRMEKCHVVSESAFALAEVARIESLIRQSDPLKMERIAISVRDWPYFKSRSNKQGREIYRQAIASLVQKLIRDYEVEVTFISTCQGLDHFKYDDSKVAVEICKLLPPEMMSHISIIKEFHHPSEIMDILREMDFVLATRFHMMVLAMCVGTPVMPIAYEFKTAELARQIGMKDVLCDIESINAGDLMGKCDIYFHNMESYRDKILHHTLEFHKSALQAVPLIREVYEASVLKRIAPELDEDTDGEFDTKLDDVFDDEI